MRNKRMRALAAATKPTNVDREAGIIYGVSAMQTGEAIGHDLLIDHVTIASVQKLGSEAPNGIKSRFTHPGMCSDGLGRYLGRCMNFRIEADKVLCDLYFSRSSFRSPDGDLANYIMDLAESDADAFGMSVSVLGYAVWIMADGSEVQAATATPPQGATTDKPYLRVTKLRAVDAVDEPAANRDGLFSADELGSYADALEAPEQAFAALDALREAQGLDLHGCYEFAMRYLLARGFTEPAAAGATTEDAMSIDAKELAALLAAHKDHHSVILDCFNAGKGAAEIANAVAEAKQKDSEAKLAALSEQLSAQTAANAELQAKVDELTAQLSEVRDLGGAPLDPGKGKGDSTGDLSVSEAEFSEMTGIQRAKFLAAGGKVE